MTDPTDELKKRFEDRTPSQDTDDDVDGETDEETPQKAEQGAGGTGDTGNMSDTSDASSTNNTRGSNNSDNPDNTDNVSNTQETATESTSGTETPSKPGPNRDANATRHRKQVPMYLPDADADAINQLYERLDGRSKVAGEGGIEKHADFMEALVDLATDNEDELAVRLGIDTN